MKRPVKVAAASAASLGLVAVVLFALGFRVVFDSAAGRVFIGRRVAYAPGPGPGGAAPRPARPLQSIQINTPDPVILENFGKDAFMAHADAVVKAAEAALAGSGAKARLTVTFHRDKETDNVVEADEKDAAAATRLADAVDAVDKDVRTKVGDVSVSFVFSDGGAPAGRSLTLAPASNEGPGAPVPSPQEEKAALAAARTLGGGAPGPWEAVTCAPAFWARLKAADPAVAAKGVPTTVHQDGGTREARVFHKNQKDGLSILASPGFQTLMRRFAEGQARAATMAERRAIYAAIPFEIDGKPATLVEAGGDRLYITPGEKMLWLDLLPGAAPAEEAAPAAPPPPSAAEAAEAEAAFRKACAAEIGILCASAGEDLAAVKACLRGQQVRAACRKALD